ncbi:hypothetical protein SAMN05421640_3469 [Ekhidna lutea]|uniref:Uncharacterized protein n=1 Tax=Ekhidna lutea TaxID=447679 RepID=A0A239LYV3_EKHLU|nr:hypothetical protein [Ekhidna lutea]SNT35142.1 hypothetical protein SAMN05421640_3469 [Ekhidna lutea]
MNQLEDLVFELQTRCKTIKISHTSHKKTNDPSVSVDKLKDHLEDIGNELPDLGEKITEVLYEILDERGIKFADEEEKKVFITKVRPTVKEIAAGIIRESI